MTREQRIAAVISQTPESAKGCLQEAFSGAASPRKAIKAFCLVCVGYDRAAIRKCASLACPLWKYRPFQGTEAEGEA